MKLFHITTETQWHLAQNLGEYKPISLKTAGFIHASTAEQVPWVFRQFYRDKPNLCLLFLDSERIKAEIRWEAPIHPQTPADVTRSPQTPFPHIYGALNLDAVIKVISLNSNLLPVLQ